MYPLLADAYALRQQISGSNIAGRNIGYYKRPLEELLEESGHKETPSFLHLKNAIVKAKEDPTAFYGAWRDYDK